VAAARGLRLRAVEADGGGALAVAVAAAELAASPSADSLDLVGALPLARRCRLVGPARRLPAGRGGGGGGARAPLKPAAAPRSPSLSLPPSSPPRRPPTRWTSWVRCRSPGGAASWAPRGSCPRAAAAAAAAPARC